MPTTYNGVAGNVSLTSTASISECADGDSDAAATFTPAFQKLTDYIEAIRTNFGPVSLTYVSNPGNVASGSYWAWAGTSQAAVAANGAAQAVGQTTHMAGFAGNVRGLIIKTGTTTAGGTVTITIWKNNSSTSAAITTGAGTTAGTILQVVTGIPLAFSLGDTLEVVVSNGGGVTTSIGLSMVTMLLSRN